MLLCQINPLSSHKDKACFLKGSEKLDFFSYVTHCPLTYRHHLSFFKVKVKKEVLLKNLGKKIKELRENKGLSQEELASLSGFDRTYISLLERGKRNISVCNLARIAKALNTNSSKLLEGVENEQESA